MLRKGIKFSEFITVCQIYQTYSNFSAVRSASADDFDLAVGRQLDDR